MIDNIDPNIQLSVSRGGEQNPFNKMATERNEYDRKDMLNQQYRSLMGKNGLGEFCNAYTYHTKESELNTIAGGHKAGTYPTINQSSTPELTQNT